jgi:hypothetical protein
MSGETVKRKRVGASKLFLAAFFIFWTALYASIARGWLPNGDPAAYFLVAASIVENRSLGMSEKSPVVPLEQGPDGRYYSKFGVGQSLLETPFYAAGKALAPRGAEPVYKFYFVYFVSVMCVPAISALGILLFFLLALELGYGLKTSAACAFLLGLATIMMPYARFGFSEPLQACMITGCALFAARARGREGVGAWAAASAGAFIGAAALAKTANLVFVPVFALYLLFSAGPRRAGFQRAASFCATAATFAAVILFLNDIRFGSPFALGYGAGRDAAFGFNVSALSGLYGLLFSPGKSVFLYAPILAASVALAGAFHKERRAENLLVWSAAAAAFLLYSRWWAWHGDWAWGPRLIVPVVPLMALPLLPVIRDFSALRPAAKTALAALAALSFFIQILGSTVNFHEYILQTRMLEPRWMKEMPERAGMRDEMLALHFAPEFSPVAGHWWLLKHTVLSRGLPADELRERMSADFPWRGLMAYAPPLQPERAAGFDYWWLHFPRFFPASARWTRPLIALLASLAAAAFAVSVLALSLKRKLSAPEANPDE